MTDFFRRIVCGLMRGRETSCRIRARLSNRTSAAAAIHRYFEEIGVRIEDVEFSADTERLCTHVYTLRIPHSTNLNQMREHLESMEDVLDVEVKTL